MEPLAVLSSIVLAVVLATPEALRRYTNYIWTHPAGPAAILHLSSSFMGWIHTSLARVRPRTPFQHLDESEELLQENYSWLKDQSDHWLRCSKLVLESPDAPVLRQYNLFQTQKSDQASPILKILQGPVEHIAGTCQATTEIDVPLHDIIKIWIGIIDDLDECLLRRARVVKTILKTNAWALELMRGVVNDSARSFLRKFDSLMALIEKSNKLIVEQSALIDSMLTLYANAIAKRQRILDELVMTASSDILIALMNLPSGWRPLQAKNSPETTSTGPGRQNQGFLTDGLRSGAAVPADIVDNVYELSKIFRGPSKSTDEAAVQDPSLLSQAKKPPRAAQVDPQHAEERKQLLRAQEDLQKLRVRVERLQKDHRTSLADQKAKAKDQDSQAMDIFVSKIKGCLGQDMLQLNGSMRERWQRYVRSVTGREGKEPEASKPATATTNPTASAACESTTTTIIG